ncbi:MAG TPA: DUF4157 domain-containing protein [Streptomyces sp.]|nr:DUF4157 domain-containing protein [Streptomyces sp.]
MRGACGGHDLAALPVGAAQPKLTLSTAGNPFEHQADAVAACVASGAAVPGPATPGPVPLLLRKPGPPRTVAASARGLSTGGGRPLDPTVRARIEPHLGADLSGVRVRTGPDVDAAAASIGARAFTLGGAIHLTGRESPYDLRLMAHEATHAVQQRAALTAHDTVLRQADGAAGPARRGVLDRLAAPIRALPGYPLLVLIGGADPLSGSRAPIDRDQLTAQLLAYGPFGPATAEALRAMEVAGKVFDLLSAALVRHHLTTARIAREFELVVEETPLADIVTLDLTVARRHLEAVLADVRALAAEAGGQIIELIREAAVTVVEPLLATPETKPVWDLAKKVLHFDPLRGVPVEAAPVDILADFMRLMGQDGALDLMRERGTLQQTADWLAAQAAEFIGILGELRAVFSAAWAAIQPQNLPNLLTDLQSLAGRAFALVRRIGDFGKAVLGQVLGLVKKSLLGLLSQHAQKIPGFQLLTVILGRNPFTGEQVPRTAESLIKGFILLLPDGERTYEQLAATGVIAEAATRIETAMAELGISGELITKTFRGIWDTLSLEDLADPAAAFTRVTDQFGEPLGRMVRFAAVVVDVVLQLVLKLLNFPSELLASIQGHVTRAIADIKRDPVAFLLHMLQALKEGFAGFFADIGAHLQRGLADWLFRGLRGLGITIPTELTAPSVLRLVLDILGVGVETLWTKLGERIGPERVAQIRAVTDKLSGAWSFVKDVQENGISALWDHLGAQLGNLWDTLLGMARDWIMTEVVDRVVKKLLSMLDPTGVMAVVNGFVAFFNAVQSAIEYLREILQIVDRYVSAFADLAAGNTTPAAKKIEEGLANAVPVAIGFLANQVGLGNIPEKAAELVRRLRALVDQALNWLFDQAMRAGSALLGKGAGAPEGAQPQHPVMGAAAAALVRQLGRRAGLETAERAVAQVLAQLRPQGLHALRLEESETGTLAIVGEASPPETLATLKSGAGKPGMHVRARITFTPGGKEAALAESITAAAESEVSTERESEVSRAGTRFSFMRRKKHLGAKDETRLRGGAVFLDGEPDVIQTLNWNTSDKVSRTSNQDHAERHFVDWLQSIRGQWPHITAIKLINDPYSPCTACAPQLEQVAAQISAARGAPVDATLEWKSVWGVPRKKGSSWGGPPGNATRPDTLPKMSHWTVLPPQLPPTGDLEYDLALERAVEDRQRMGPPKAGPASPVPHVRRLKR